MTLDEAKKQFIAAWGAMGSNWGVSRTMAQIHALLLSSSKPVSTEDIMAALSISRGNANMNTRELISWGLAERVVISGERREFFTGEKDIWKVAGIIARERKRRELDPMVKVLDQLDIDANDTSEDAEAFRTLVQRIGQFAGQVNKTLDTMTRAEEHWFLGNLLKWLN